MGSKFPGERGASSSRVSSKKQARKDKLSIPLQMEDNKRKAIERGVELVDEFAEPVSGRKARAERLQRLDELVEAGRIQHIFFHSSDRAFRKLLVAEECWERWGQRGIHVWVAGQCVTHANANLRAMHQMSNVWSEHGSNMMRERGGMRGVYAERGTTYRTKAPPGFTLEAFKGKAKRLAVIAEQKELFHTLFLDVAANGARFTFHSQTGHELRQLYPQIRTPADLAAIIRDPIYQGLNTYGEEAFKTLFTEENRIVGAELFQNANRSLDSKSRRKAGFADAATKVGVTTILDRILEDFVVLCQRCLAPVHRGRLLEYEDVVVPSLECCGTPLDFEALAKIKREKGILEAADVAAALNRDPAARRVHEVTVLSGAQVDDARASRYRCDNCYKVRLSNFEVTSDGVYKRLLCLSCQATRRIPRHLWQNPVVVRAKQPQLSKWIPEENQAEGH